MGERRTPLVIVGAGGLGRETAAAIRALDAGSPQWDLLGFVDDDPELQDQTIDGLPVLGSIDTLSSGLAGTRAVVCTARPQAPLSRRTITERLGFADDRYTSIVHPSAAVAAGTDIGAGSVLLAQVVVTTPLVIGRHVAVMPHVVFTHDDVIGDYSTFGSGVRLGGGVVIGEGAYLGAGALVREHVTIGAGALIGMGAVVTRDVPPGEIWVGNPAARLVRDKGSNRSRGDRGSVNSTSDGNGIGNGNGNGDRTGNGARRGGRPVRLRQRHPSAFRSQGQGLHPDESEGGPS